MINFSQKTIDSKAISIKKGHVTYEPEQGLDTFDMKKKPFFLERKIISRSLNNFFNLDIRQKVHF